MTQFKYGSLIIKCHQCGNEEVIEDLVTDGRDIYLFNHDDSFLSSFSTSNMSKNLSNNDFFKGL